MSVLWVKWFYFSKKIIHWFQWRVKRLLSIKSKQRTKIWLVWCFFPISTYQPPQRKIYNNLRMKGCAMIPNTLCQGGLEPGMTWMCCQSMWLISELWGAIITLPWLMKFNTLTRASPPGLASSFSLVFLLLCFLSLRTLIDIIGANLAKCRSREWRRCRDRMILYITGQRRAG